MNIIERERDGLGALPRALSLYLKQPLGIYLDNDSLISLYFKSKHLFRNFNLKKRSEAIGPFKDGTQKWLTSVETLEILWVELIFKSGLGSRSVSPTHSRLSERPLYTMLHDARHPAPLHHFGSKWSQTGRMRRTPTHQICLNILGGVTRRSWLYSSNCSSVV